MGFKRVTYEINEDTGEAREIGTEFMRQKYARKARPSSERFVWARYELGAPWLQPLQRADAARITFLSTFLTYDGFLSGGNHRALREEDVKPLIGLSERRFFDFWDLVKKRNIFYLKDGKIYPDKKLFRKGELRSAAIAKNAERGVYFTRMYADVIQQLYRSVPPASVRVLGYIFQILPYVHREFNIVCHNPLETDFEKIRPLKLSEFCKLVGYNKRGSRRLLSQLTGMRVTVDGEEQPAVSYENYPARQLAYGIFINPNIYYAGSDILAVELMGAFRRRDRIPERKEGEA